VGCDILHGKRRVKRGSLRGRELGNENVQPEKQKDTAGLPVQRIGLLRISMGNGQATNQVQDIRRNHRGPPRHAKVPDRRGGEVMKWQDIIKLIVDLILFGVVFMLGAFVGMDIRRKP
jgi:hypothetical protein